MIGPKSTEPEGEERNNLAFARPMDSRLRSRRRKNDNGQLLYEIFIMTYVKNTRRITALMSHGPNERGCTNARDTDERFRFQLTFRSIVRVRDFETDIDCRITVKTWIVILYT